MVRIAIVEDEDSYVEILQSFLKRYQEECGQKFYVTVFRDGDEIVEKYKANFDIILMDIKMRCMDGMTAAEHIREVDQEVIIMFITNMIQYAIRGYAVNAMDYILKPVKYFAFFSKIGTCTQSSGEKRKEFCDHLDSRGRIETGTFSNLLYRKSRPLSCVSHEKGGVYEQRQTFRDGAIIESAPFFPQQQGISGQFGICGRGAGQLCDCQ